VQGLQGERLEDEEVEMLASFVREYEWAAPFV
jgi:hypothetical protein